MVRRSDTRGGGGGEGACIDEIAVRANKLEMDLFWAA